MKRSRFSEEQIIAVLKEQEAGMATADVCRRHGISSATFYKWKAKYGGLEVSDARRLRSLEEENARLKRLLADAMLDNAMLKEISTKKFGRLAPSGRRWLIFRRFSRRASVGPARRWAWIERQCATSAVGRTMPRHEPVSASWRGSAAGSAIADCTGCCAGKDGR